MEVLRSTGVTAREAEAWSDWLRAAEDITRTFEPWWDDPFGYNETASVGILAAAAFRGGLVALPEYVARKGTRGNRRKRYGGRCDLWLASARVSWAFEFKSMILGVPPRLTTLKSRLDRAVECAGQVTGAEADKRVGCLIVSTYNANGEDAQIALGERLASFKAHADFAAVIRPGNDYAEPTFFFMRHFH